jgi:hypothetical protein
MAKVSSETDKMIEGLMKYSLRPYAQANNISVDELVIQLYKYHHALLDDKYRDFDFGSEVETETTEKEKEDNENKLVEPKKKGRGRPPGAKNKKVKSSGTNANTKMVIKRGGGIPSSSKV